MKFYGLGSITGWCITAIAFLIASQFNEGVAVVGLIIIPIGLALIVLDRK